jgi:hypothetical protein
MGSAVNAASGVLGGVIQGITSNVIPGANLANQDQVNKQIAALNSQSNTNLGTSGQLLGNASDQLNITGDYYRQAQRDLTNAIGANEASGDAVNILRNAALGNAPSAAQAQLQSGKDQAIATQAAMANSGNLSQMLGGQKTAMDNAANLTQQAANQSAQLRAQEMATARGQYGSQTAQYANQAAQNAANQTNLAASSANLYGTQLGAAGNFGNLANYGAVNAGNLALGQTGQQQGALNQAQAQQAHAAGGMLNGVGGALGSLAGGNTVGEAASTMLSDYNSKTNIQLDSQKSEGQKNWEDLVDFITGGKKKKQKEETTNMLLDMSRDNMASSISVASDTAPDTMVSDENTKQNVQSDQASRAKSISNYFRDQSPQKADTASPSSSDSTSPAKTGGAYDSSDDNRKKFAKGISDSFASDKDMKKDVKKSSMLHRFLDELEPVTFEYKEPTGEMGKTPGVHMGIIAQDVEKAPGGESMIVETPEGKGIDMASAMGMLMSAAADAHDRVSSLEELFKSRKAK